MTLPSRKKPQTTRQSINPAIAPDGKAAALPLEIQDSYEGPVSWPWNPSRRTGETIWLPAALLAALVLLTSAMRAFGDEGNLRWQRPNLPQSRESLNPRPSLREVPATPRRSSSVPVTTQAKKVYAVQQAAYTQEEGWARSDAGRNVQPAEFESVIIRRDDSFDLAQAPEILPPQQPQQNDLESQLDLPFGEPAQDFTQPGFRPEPLPADDLSDDLFDSMQQPATPVQPSPFDQPPRPDTTRDPGFDSQQPTFNPDEQFDTLPERSSPAQRSLGTGIAVTPEERILAEETCQEELEAIRASRIASISLAIAPTGEAGRDYPFECSIDDGTPYEGRHWAEITYMWKAAANCHKPLYFEQVQAERYGHSLPPYLQPICSGAHFFGSLVTLPYQMGLTPPNECIYPLGHYRPGNCAPYMVPAVPFTWRAVGAQAGAAVGVSAILP